MPVALLLVAFCVLVARPPSTGEAQAVSRAATLPATQPTKATSKGITGTVFHHTIDSEHLGAARKIRVWLPEELDPEKPVPVLYMHDGQNLFDNLAAPHGGWKVDDTVTALIDRGEMGPVIVVGIDNGGNQRIAELSYTKIDRLGGGEAETYAKFVLEEVLPLVEGKYNVSKNPADRYLGGSSLGGLVSLEMAYRHPGKFGGVIAMSPSIWWPNDPLLTRVANDPAGLAGTRVWLDMGAKETGDAAQNRQLVNLSRQLSNVFKQHGIEHRIYIGPSDKHNEVAWARRFPRAAKYLFGNAE